MSVATHQFDASVGQTLLRVRAAYAALLGALPRGCGNAIAVERVLGLNKKLSWQVFRVATAADALAAGGRVPGPAALPHVARAAARAGVAADVVAEVEAATRAFHATVRDHAEDRNSFDLMVSAVTGDGLAGRDLEVKRAAFRANRQLVGRCCEADLFTLMVHPGAARDTVDMCALRGLDRLYRLRPHVSLEISRHRFDRTDGTVQGREPVEPPRRSEPAGLLRDFSTQPLPPLRTVQNADGWVRVFADSAGLGFASAVSCHLADVTRSSPMRDAPDDAHPGVGHIHEVATPARVLIQDLVVDERVGGEPALRVLASRRDAANWPGDDRSVLLPVGESIERLGRGLDHATAHELPRYRPMLESVASTLGWDPARFIVYRTRIEFPVLHSVVWMRLAL